MPHVEIHAPGVGEKSPVARRFIMSAVVEVEHAPPLDMKEMIANLVGKPCRRVIGPILIDEESVFRFKPENTVQHIEATTA